MKREEKQVIIDNLTEQIKAHKHIYISDISELDAAATQELRRACFKAGIKLCCVLLWTVWKLTIMKFIVL